MNKVANVVFAYSPKNEDELELRVGDKIEVIGVEEEGWWKGKLKGRVGVFPTNFVQVLETLNSPTNGSQQQPAPTLLANNNNTTTSSSTSFAAAVSSAQLASTAAAAAPISTQSANINSSISSTVNKLSNIFANKQLNSSTGGKSNLLASNSSLNNNNNSNNSINSNNTTTNNILPSMNNNYTQQDANSELDSLLSSINSSSERKQKSIRGVGYGDIFAAAAASGGGPGAKNKFLPAEPVTSSSSASATTNNSNSLAGERLSSGSSIVSNTLQRQIPKKPPPPTPVSDPEQAPALPPKPSNNQFSPPIHSRPFAHQHHQQKQATQQVREQAKVIYAYEPSNEDELAMEVGDIIDIIDKEIEDVGWWKGELRGKIGVFPDNFVQLIEVPIEQQQQQLSSAPVTPSSLDWHSTRQATVTSNSIIKTTNASNNSTTAAAAATATTAPNSTQAAPLSSQPATPNYSYHNIVQSKIKPVFAATPKDFSKELESNLQQNINNNPASLLSLKRNKLQQQISSIASSIDSTKMEENSVKDSGRLQASDNDNHSNTSKLNHITANRAKGPARRPPSNILNKRTQQDNQVRKESNVEDETSCMTTSLPSSILTSPSSVANNYQASISSHDSMSSLPAGHQSSAQHQLASTMTGNNSYLSYTRQNDVGQNSASNSSTATSTTSNITSPSNNNNNPPIAFMRPNHITDSSNTADDLGAPRVNQRSNQQGATNLLDKGGKTINASGGSSNPSTPPWMVELKKAHAEKKRDIPANGAAAAAVVTTNIPNNITPGGSNSSIGNGATNNYNVDNDNTSSGNNNSNSNANSIHTSTATNHNSNQATDDLVKQISKSFSAEINELKTEVRQLREDFKGFNGMKSAMEIMRIELKACQSATENQRKYIKDLVNNLADERKKIAAMQDEIDRNLK